jgi:hypothetical protein
VFLLIVVSAQAWVPRVAFGLCARVHPKSLAAIEGSAWWSCCHGEPWDEHLVGGATVVVEGFTASFYQLTLE